ncbi:hypothetical protein [Ideonella dechloratans]|uniref:hypothetical protein n=1 Tax=Ideonella dechloratans TaxID=36863 RepID=UPI0035B46C53
MARTKNITPIEPIENVTEHDATGLALAKMRYEQGQMADQVKERETQVRALAITLGYQLPADATDPDLIQRDIAANMRRSVEACLEVGRGLTVLKAACAHGEFLPRLDALGLEARVAQKFMSAAAKFANASSTTHLAAIGNQTKLFELLVLDDDQVDDLLQLGHTGELKLDDIATMSVKELRAALREEREERKAAEDVSAEKSKKIDALHKKIKRVQAAEPDEVLQEITKEAAGWANDALGALRGNLRLSMVTLRDHCEQHGLDLPTVFMAGIAGQLQAALNDLRAEFELPDVSDAAIPEWVRQSQGGANGG